MEALHLLNVLFFFKCTELRGLDLLTGVFTIRQIKAATDNFDAANKIGEGGFGSVYKVNLNLSSHKLSNFFGLATASRRGYYV